MHALILALSIATTPTPSCAWDTPGANPYKGYNETEALNDYNFSPEAKARLKAKMEAHQYDDIVVIGRESVIGHEEYGDLRDMHFGGGDKPPKKNKKGKVIPQAASKPTMCHGAVTRDKWGPSDNQIGLVYCDDAECVVVPTICNNVSLITKKHGDVVDELEMAPPAAGGGGGGAAAPPDSFVGGGAPPVAIADAPPGETDCWFCGGGGGGGGWGGGGGGIGGGGGGGSGPTGPTGPTGPIGPPGPPWIPPGCGCLPPPVCPPPVSSVPEAPSLWMYLGGAALLIWLKRSRRKRVK